MKLLLEKVLWAQVPTQRAHMNIQQQENMSKLIIKQVMYPMHLLHSGYSEEVYIE